MSLDKKYSTILYTILYASIVTFCTLYTQRWPALLQMENAIYDPMQWVTALNSADQCRYPQLADQLEKIVYINLDTAFINVTTDQVNKKKATELLSHIATNSSPKVIFFDYFFKQFDKQEMHIAEEDSLLIRSIQQLEDRLVLPYSVKIPPYKTWNPVPFDSMAIDQKVVYQPLYSGYANNLYMVGDNIYRYHIPKKKNDTLCSSAYAIVKALLNDETSLIDKNLPDIFEINYLINEVKLDAYTLPFLRGLDASDIMLEEKASVARLLKDKVVFISWLGRYENKYSKQINQFKTPVNSELSSIYILINTYLNLLNHSYFTRAPMTYILLVNFILAWIGIFYYKKMMACNYKSTLLIIIEVILSILLFYLLLLMLYWWWNIKFPFVLSSLAFTRNQWLLNIFNKRIQNII